MDVRQIRRKQQAEATALVRRWYEAMKPARDAVDRLYRQGKRLGL